MPRRKTKYNARFPPGRIKKIMQVDEEVGKVAAAVPVGISRAVELFIEEVVIDSSKITEAKGAKTISALHMKQVISMRKHFNFLHDLVANISETSTVEEDDSRCADVKPSSSEVAETSDPQPVRKEKEVKKGRRGRKKKTIDGSAPVKTELESGDNPSVTDVPVDQQQPATASTFLPAPGVKLETEAEHKEVKAEQYPTLPTHASVIPPSSNAQPLHSSAVLVPSSTTPTTSFHSPPLCSSNSDMHATSSSHSAASLNTEHNQINQHGIAYSSQPHPMRPMYDNLYQYRLQQPMPYPSYEAQRYMMPGYAGLHPMMPQAPAAAALMPQANISNVLHKPEPAQISVQDQDTVKTLTSL